jgi:hypothetical protein
MLSPSSQMLGCLLHVDFSQLSWMLWTGDSFLRTRRSEIISSISLLAYAYVCRRGSNQLRDIHLHSNVFVHVHSTL